ncbi:MAG: hypothetical protein WKF84_19965 [Pyrinomonadaceae bacterium]
MKTTLAEILRRALADEARGLAALQPALLDDLLTQLARSAAGDARVALAALEAAVVSTDPDAQGIRHVTSETIIEALGRAPSLTTRAAKSTTTWPPR